MPLQTTRDVPAVLTANGTLKAGAHNRVSAAAAARTMALPTSPGAGASLSVVKSETSTNAVTVTGGDGGNVVLRYQGSAAEFIAAGGTWYLTELSFTEAALTTMRDAGIDGLRSSIEAVVFHDGTASGGNRPSGYRRVRWVGGTARPSNMATGDVWERDA